MFLKEARTRETIRDQSEQRKNTERVGEVGILKVDTPKPSPVSQMVVKNMYQRLGIWESEEKDDRAGKPLLIRVNISSLKIKWSTGDR